MTEKLSIQTEKRSFTLKSVFSKGQTLLMQPVKDLKTNWYKGVPRLSDDDKRKLEHWVEPNTKIKVRHGMVINLNDPIDAANWEWMQYSSKIAGSFKECQASNEALFYVDDEESESRSEYDQSLEIAKAMRYVAEDTDDTIYSRARLLGFDMSSEKPIVVRQFLMKKAKKVESYREVLNVYESSNLGVQLLYLKARDKDVIKLNNGAYMFGNAPLGVSEEMVIAFLQDPLNREITMGIERATNPELYGAATSKTTSPKKPSKKELDEDVTDSKVATPALEITAPEGFGAPSGDFLNP